MNRNIKAELARYDMTIECLAKEVGISTVSMSNKINGKSTWSLAEAKRIVDIFNAKGSSYTVDTMFFDERTTASAR